MKQFWEKFVYTITYFKIPKSYCCAKCGAEQREETSTHIILCNSCVDVMFGEMQERNARTRKFLEDHEEEILAFNKSEMKRLGYE